MSRALRFRVWDVTERRWGSFEAFIGEGYTDLNDQRDDVVITQFTGLLDSKGREIYEGDIVKWGGEREVVSWLEGSTGWYPFAGQAAWAAFFNNRGPVASTVLGNIFEHSHLLK